MPFTGVAVKTDREQMVGPWRIYCSRSGVGQGMPLPRLQGIGRRLALDQFIQSIRQRHDLAGDAALGMPDNPALGPPAAPNP